MRLLVLPCVVLVWFAGCTSKTEEHAGYRPELDSLRYEDEVHLRNIRQLTFGGNNAEAYWSFDDEALIFQSDWDQINEQGCDQIFVMDPDADVPDYRLVSTGLGRTTCAHFLPDGRMLYSSTHAADSACPVPENMPEGYVWPVHATYDIYVANPGGSDPRVLIGGSGYDAEATVSPDGRFIVFTSDRSGDLDLWRYEIATGALLQLTDVAGYDGGAFFSRDSQQIVWRASRPDESALEEYTELLADGFVKPGELNIFVANIDGSAVRQVTDLPGANWSPFFHPSGQRIIFASNYESSSGGRPVFSLYMIGVDGTGLRRLTHSNTFEAFAMFSFDGKRIVFSSNRNKERVSSRNTNVFVADWIEEPESMDIQFQSVIR